MLVDCILLSTVRLSNRWAEGLRAAGRGIVAFVLLPTVSLLGLYPERTKRFYNSGLPVIFEVVGIVVIALG